MSSEDDAILEAARRTSSILGLGGFSPTTVTWQDVEYPGSRGARVVTPHFPALERTKLVISPMLRRRVEPEDWGSILAPPLIFNRQLKKAYNMRVLIRVLPGLLLILAFFIYGYLFVPHPPGEFVLVWIVGAVTLLVLGVYSVIRLGRSFVLKADKEAALVLGSASLIEALRKLEVLREQDASQGHEWPEYGDHPSINKRIASLRSP